jgi:hypothetical protein
MIRAVTDSKWAASSVIMPKPRKKYFPILLLMVVALSGLALPAEA